MKSIFLLFLFIYNLQSPTLKYQWRKISGPSHYIIVTPNAPTTAVTDLEAGIYQFELMVTNSRGLSSRDTMRLTVKFQDPNSTQNSLARAMLSPKKN